MTANIHNRHATAIAANLAQTGTDSIAMTWSNAGHPPPLILEPGRTPRYLVRPANPPLGLVAGAIRDSHTISLPAGRWGA